jgi:hypothetical protein
MRTPKKETSSRWAQQVMKHTTKKDKHGRKLKRRRRRMKRRRRSGFVYLLR